MREIEKKANRSPESHPEWPEIPPPAGPDAAGCRSEPAASAGSEGLRGCGQFCPPPCTPGLLFFDFENHG